MANLCYTWPKARVGDFILPDRTWNLGLLKDILNDHPVISRIVDLPLPTSDVGDYCCWGLTSSDEFSTKSATWLAQGCRQNVSTEWQYSWTWKTDTLPKIQIFLRQMCHKALPVRGLLRQRGIALHPACPLGQQQQESITHLFLLCPVVSKAWDLTVSQGWLSPGIPLGNTLDFWSFMDRFLSHQSQRMKQRISLLLWFIWKMRNAIVFNSAAFNLIPCLIKAKRAVAEWCTRNRLPVELGAPFTRCPKSYGIVRWESPPPGVVKLNFDGSCRDPSASGGFILRDWMGRLLWAGAYNYGTTSITLVEARAMRHTSDYSSELSPHTDRR